jgi:prepilin-type N-terminal cleavage/methylation domain-containing protein
MNHATDQIMQSPGRRRRAFTLIELLVVIGIISVLVGILVPTTGAVRRQAQKCVCASNLRQMGNGLLMYVQDHRGRLPLVVEPMWKNVATLGTADLSVDPRSDPRSFINVMKPYGVSERLMTCPSYVFKAINTPESEPVQTYRVSAANSSDNFVQLIHQMQLPGGYVDYKFSRKYLNGRPYALEHALPEIVDDQLVGVLRKGAGPFWLIRDFVGKKVEGKKTTYIPPHNKQFNQLKLDMSVSLEKDDAFGFASP